MTASTALTSASGAPIETPEEVSRPGLVRRLLRNPLALVSLIALLVLILLAVIGPIAAPFSPTQGVLTNAFAPPGSSHLLGTDSAGRDILSRLLVGARNTLLAAALAAGVALVVGVPIGLLAGYFGGRIDAIASWISNVLMALPAIVILLAVTAALGSSVWISMTVFGVLMSPGFYRLTRATVQVVRNELYVDAARVAGLSFWSILGRHILFVVRAPIIIQASVVAGIAISIQAGLEFLGLGDPSVASWGLMLTDGFSNIYNYPLLVLWPAAAITIATAAFIVFGSALRDALEDTGQSGRVRRAKRKAVLGSPTTSAPSGSHLLEVSSLRIGYPTEGGRIRNVVSDVSLSVDRGQIVGLVGESGSGKSQTAFAVLGLLPEAALIESGTILFDGVGLVGGVTVRNAGRRLAGLRGRRIAYVPQEPMSNLDPNFTIGHQLARPMVKSLGLSRAEAHHRAVELLALVGIPEPDRVMGSYPHQISGGMAQRVLIAGAVSCSPDLLIADEPTTALDVTVQAEVLDLLRDLQARFQMGVLLVTHNFGVVADICDEVAVMEKGRIVEHGDVRTIMRAPKHPYTRTLLGSMLEGKEPLTMLTATDTAGAVS